MCCVGQVCGSHCFVGTVASTTFFAPLMHILSSAGWSVDVHGTVCMALIAVGVALQVASTVIGKMYDQAVGMPARSAGRYWCGVLPLSESW
jgi:hypothetical protein